MNVGYANFANLTPKLVAVATSLSDRQKGQIVICTHRPTSTYPENLVNIYPVCSEIIGIKGDR